MQKYLDPTQWDYPAIFFNVVASFVFIGLLHWGGLFRRVWKWRKKRKTLKHYLNDLRADCELLIVIGRRKGFQLPDVYVPLDIAKSSLMATRRVKFPEEDLHFAINHDQRNYVLVGGPGAGKSTTVKKLIISAIDDREQFPIFLRLRDFVGFKTIEEFVASKLKEAGFEGVDLTMYEISREGCICVLDGLDEIRPSSRPATIEAINGFYHKYFAQQHANALIVTCRKEAYRSIPLDFPVIMEVRPLTDEQIRRFCQIWPLGFPTGKNADTFWRDLNSTPRILELARSPLLLVGGLVHYTESNSGIPEQRYEYLSRVARWLVVEWASAQGHPPDPFRAVYDRILPKLAYMLHKQQTAELKREEVEKAFSEWLPGYGFPGEKAAEILDSISTKTGILVSEDKNFVVFAQFGLQEYFASLESVESLSAQKLAKLEPKDWWREVILLSVARQRDPNPILAELFLLSPLIAAAAVAECPTPSLEMQKKAIEACLKGVDAGEKGVPAALVPLLRRVSGGLERELCGELDKRLVTANSGSSTIVGLCLATAGTEYPTTILANHPEVWNDCLKEAGFLSTSFENLLVDWIKNGTESQSVKAATLISSRLSNDRLQQLLQLLPTLPQPRSGNLAELILTAQINNEDGYFSDEVELWLISRTVPYISGRENFLKKLFLGDESLGNLRASRWRQYAMERGHTALVSTALFLEDGKTKKRYDREQIYTAVLDCMFWCRDRSSYLLYALSVLTIVGPVFGAARFPTLLLLLLFVLSMTFASNTACRYPWSQRRRIYFDRFDFARFAIFTLLGAIGAMSYIWWENLQINLGLRATLSIGVVLLGLIHTISAQTFGPDTIKASRLPRRHRLLPKQYIDHRSSYRFLVPILYIALLGFSIWLVNTIGMRAAQLTLFYSSLGFFVWAVWALIEMRMGHMRTSRAAGAARDFMVSLESEMPGRSRLGRPVGSGHG